MADRLALPIAITRQGLASVVQNSEQDIAQSVDLLLNTRPGDRRSAPEYGLPDPVFRGATKPEVIDVVKRWEPRADLDQIEITNDPGGTQIGYSDGDYGAGYYGG